jgi:hypothetical protein
MAMATPNQRHHDDFVWGRKCEERNKIGSVEDAKRIFFRVGILWLNINVARNGRVKDHTSCSTSKPHKHNHNRNTQSLFI